MTPKHKAPGKGGNGRRLAGWARSNSTALAYAGLLVFWAWLIVGGGR